jgi:hypothetical protein
MKPSTKKRLLGAGVAVGVLVALGVVAFVALDPQAAIQKKKDELLATASQKIGRELTSGTVSAKVGTSLRASIEGVSLAGPARADGTAAPPQLEVKTVHLQLSLLRALLTFGKDLHVERFTIDGLTVRAARDVDGRWDFQDILDAVASDDAPEAEEKSSSPLEGVRIASVLLRDARVELNDAVIGRPLRVDALNMGVSDVVLGDPLKVWLKANLVDGTKTSPIDLRVEMATLPKDLVFNPMPNLDVNAIVTDVDMGAWGNLLPTDAPGPVAGSIRTDLKVALKDNMSLVTVGGTAFARGLVLRDAIGATATRSERQLARRGAALDLDVAVDVALKGEVTTVKQLSIKGSGAAVDGTLTMEGSGLAGLKTAQVNAKVDDLARFLNALPPSLRGLPPEADIDGPVAVRLQKTGDALDIGVDLDGAHVVYTSVDDAGVSSVVFNKARGKALNLNLKGQDKGGTLEIPEFALVIDTLRLGGKLSIPSGSDAPFTADIHSGAVRLASLQGMVPPFAAAIGRGQKVDGTLQIDVVASAQGKKQIADAGVQLSGLDINLEGLQVRGKGGVTVKAQPGDKDVAIVATADFDGLQIQKGTSLNKPSGLPLRLDVDVRKGEDSATINAVKLVVGKSQINGKGSVTAMGTKDERLALDFGTVDVAFNDLRQALPGAQTLPAGGRLRGSLALRGATSAERLGIDAKNLDMTFGTSIVKGNLSVENLDTPKLDIDLSTVALAFDDVRGISASMADLPKGGRYDGTIKVVGDTAKMSTMQIDAKITRFLAAKSDLKGAIQIKNLDKPQFVLGTQSDLLDVDALRAALGGGDDDSSGKKPSKDENPSGLSKATRDMLAGVNGKATLQAKKAIVKGMTITNFTGVLVMRSGVATFEKLDFGFYGGTVSASGTSLDLPQQRTRYDLRLDGENIDFGAVVAAHTPLGRLFKGTVSPKLDVKGRGLAPGDFAITADGPAALKFKQLNIGGLDILGPLNDAMKSKAPGFNANAAAPRDTGLTLNNFTALTKFIGGRLRLEKPIDADTPMGKMKIEGSTGMDARLDLTSVLSLTPQMISSMTGGKVKPKNAVPVPMKIGGTWDNPRVSNIDVKALLQAVVGDAVKDVVDSVVDKGKDKAKDAVDKNKDKAKDKAKDVVNDVLGGIGGGKKKKK